MKKLLCFLLIIGMIFSICACGNDDSSTVSGAKPSSGGIELAEDDPVYAEIADMLAPIYDFVEYNHILNNSIDYKDVNAEDFWNIVAITIAAYPRINQIAEIDDVDVCHIKWDLMIDFAKTFLYRTWHRNNAPSYKESYSASADPGSGIIDLVPLSVENFIGSLAGIDAAKTDNQGYDYILHVDLSTPEDNPTIHHYNVFLSDWNDYIRTFEETDKGDHIMPYVVTGYEYVSTDEPNESEN